MPLPLFDGGNYLLNQNAPEVSKMIQETRDNLSIGGSEIAVPPPGPDGNPYLFIFVGPTAEHRGSAFRLHMATSDGVELPNDAKVVVESFYKSGSERQTIFEGEYGQFQAIADQSDADSTLSVQRRVESGEDYFIRIEVSVAEGLAIPDTNAVGSDFDLDIVKLWWNESA